LQNACLANPPQVNQPLGVYLAKIGYLMSEKTLSEIAFQMAEAIREWNRAKREREEWKPVVGQVPPIGILGSAKKANAMLSKALEDYEAFQQITPADSEYAPRCLCPADGIYPGCPIHGGRSR
jgi:hypothetical protein